MSDFILIKSEYDQIPSLLKEIVPDFFESAEFKQLRVDDVKLPGIVCARFAAYLVWLHETFNQKRTEKIRSNLAKCYLAIERLASSGDPLVQNVVVTEIFETLDCGLIVLEQIKSRLGPQARALYDEWIG
jgi:hypothetical protein